MNTLENSEGIEPELLRGVPRPVRIRKNYSRGLGCMQLFLAPFIIVGIFSLLWLFSQTLVLVFGTYVPARVTSRYIESDGEGSSCNLRISYVWNNIRHDEKLNVSDRGYRNVQEGSTIQVKVLASSPGLTPIWLPGINWLFPWGFAVFWNAILSFFVFLFFIAPKQQRYLARYGLPVRGSIIDKRTKQGGESDRYLLKYEFSPNTDAWSNVARNQLQPEIYVTREQWDQVNIGDELTVLYHPRKPQRSTPYRFAYYEVLH